MTKPFSAALAEARGLRPEFLVREAVDRMLFEGQAGPGVGPGTEAETRNIADVILDNMKDVPAETMAAMPRDGASQHDHYIYRLAETRGMISRFADTFYQIALTDSSDSAHRRALSFAFENGDARLAITAEVWSSSLPSLALHRKPFNAKPLSI